MFPYNYSNENFIIQTNENITWYNFEITPLVQGFIILVVTEFLFFFLFNLLFLASTHQDLKKKKIGHKF